MRPDEVEGVLRPDDVDSNNSISSSEDEDADEGDAGADILVVVLLLVVLEHFKTRLKLRKFFSFHRCWLN